MVHKPLLNDVKKFKVSDKIFIERRLSVKQR